MPLRDPRRPASELPLPITTERIRDLAPFVFSAILLLGLGLRLAPWGRNRFLEDESLYAYWGLQIATGADPLLDWEPVDKPPLHPYTLALSFLLSGLSPAPGIHAGHETTARLPSLLASMVGIALVYTLGWHLSEDKAVGLLAALLLALSPFDILFASTAFTDPLMAGLVLGSLLAATKGRLGTAGLLAGLAGATKQQGIFFLPLVIALGLGGSRPRVSHSRLRGARFRRFAGLLMSGWFRFLLGFALIAGGTAWWDLSREQRPGFVEQSMISYGGLGPAQPEALGQRALEWLRLVGSFWISPWLNAMLLAALILWLLGGRLGWWAGWSRNDVAMGTFGIGFLLFHWLVGFQVWDRYLLGLVPLIAVLAAKAFVTLGRAISHSSWRRLYAVGLAVALAACLAGPVRLAARSELPLGGDHGAYDGIDLLAGYLRTQTPAGTVLYHHWLGYHYRFYLYGAPLRLHWYPDLEDLVHDAYVYRREPRYIAFPSWHESTPARIALAENGMELVPVFETSRRDGTLSFRLYQLGGP